MTDAWNIWCGYVALLFALCISQQAFAVAIVGRVMRVSDGDTVWVTDAAKLKHKVRLNRIDAPEKDQPWGKESAAILKGCRWQLASGKGLFVNALGYDTAGRRVSLSTTKDGRIWDLTTWAYDPATGKCTAKRYPDGSQAGFGGLLALDRASISETF